MQQARVQMHPDTAGRHTPEEAGHDPLLEEGRRRAALQRPRHARLWTGKLSFLRVHLSLAPELHVCIDDSGLKPNWALALHLTTELDCSAGKNDFSLMLIWTTLRSVPFSPQGNLLIGDKILKLWVCL